MGIEIAEKSKEAKNQTSQHVKHTEISIWTSQYSTYLSLMYEETTVFFLSFYHIQIEISVCLTCWLF